MEDLLTALLVATWSQAVRFLLERLTKPKKRKKDPRRRPKRR